jgi:hypothetical protein
MAMQIRRVQKGNPDKIGMLRGLQPARHRTSRRSSAEQAEELAPIWRPNDHAPRF